MDAAHTVKGRLDDCFITDFEDGLALWGIPYTRGEKVVPIAEASRQGRHWRRAARERTPRFRMARRTYELAAPYGKARRRTLSRPTEGECIRQRLALETIHQRRQRGQSSRPESHQPRRATSEPHGRRGMP